MKGLLLKDIYMTVKYCRVYILISLFFTVFSLYEKGHLFFVFYPCLLCGMIPVNLLGYDERSGWVRYSETMPYTRSQIVSAKYLIGLGAQLIILLITGISQAVQMSIGGTFSLTEYLVLMMLLLTMSLVASSLTLPFIFKLGVEKGRMAYYIMIGIVSAVCVIISNLSADSLIPQAMPDILLPAICLIGIGIYTLSWYLSVVFYRKREI